MGAIPGLYVHRIALRKQEFLKNKDDLKWQHASFQMVGNGTRIAFAGSVFGRENDDAKD